MLRPQQSASRKEQISEGSRQAHSRETAAQSLLRWRAAPARSGTRQLCRSSPVLRRAQPQAKTIVALEHNRLCPALIADINRLGALRGASGLFVFAAIVGDTLGIEIPLKRKCDSHGRLSDQRMTSAGSLTIACDGCNHKWIARTLMQINGVRRHLSASLIANF